MWAKEYNSCKECNSVEFKHYGKGYCRRCYKRYRYELNPEPFKKSERDRYIRKSEQIRNVTKSYYERHKPEISVKLKHKREDKWFSGLRETVLARDGNKCQTCNKAGNIVHHKDGNGRGSPSPNNSLENLITLCRSCHCKLHNPRLNTGKRMKI